MPVDVYLFCVWTTHKDLCNMSQFLLLLWGKKEEEEKNTTKK